MISSLEIQGYRGFERFETTGLGRLNLLVGPNNGGKTSVLESIFLLMSAGDPAAVYRVLSRRGEVLVTEGGSPLSLRTDAEVRHLFRGHEIHSGASFTLSAMNQTPPRSVAFAVRETDVFLPDADGGLPPGLALEVTGHPQPFVPMIPLSRSGALREGIDTPRRSDRRTSEPVVFIAMESLTINELVGLWNSVALTSSESLVLRALQFIDKDIERIAVQVATGSFFLRNGSRGGFIVKRRGDESPTPIGSLGDGVWRMLVMAVAITQCRGGVLLVDEIDAGLHHSAMSKMWRLIFNAAKELDVQVFATTHSFDCVYSLAPICADAGERNSITVQRIEPGKSKAIPYAQDEIMIVAEGEIEVR